MKIQAATRLTASEAADKRDVVRFCKENGIALDSQHGIPLMSKGESLLEVFDTWAEAKAFLVSQQRDYQNSGRKTPWLA